MAYNTIISQGRFTSTGAPVTIQVPSGFDWIETTNLTQIAAAGAGALRCEWQRGMPSGQGISWSDSGAVTLTQLAASTGFTPVDTSNPLNQLGVSTAITNTTNATNPVLTTASTAALSVGTIVRLYNMSSGNGVNGMDFVIDNIPSGTTFRLAGIFATAPFANGAATGQYRIVNFQPPFYPPYRYIINATQANPMVLTLSVPSLYTVGQEVTFSIPSGFGMTQLSGLTGTVTAVSDPTLPPTITVNIDSTTFSAFTFPVNNAVFTGRAIVAPVGANTAYIIGVNGNILNDAVYNTGFHGVTLAAGANSPAGVNADVIYYVIGKSIVVNNN